MEGEIVKASALKLSTKSRTRIAGHAAAIGRLEVGEAYVFPNKSSPHCCLAAMRGRKNNPLPLTVKFTSRTLEDGSKAIIRIA